MSGPSGQRAKRPAGLPPCPSCRRPRDARYRPFCSARCRDVDLGRWLDGSYAIPAVEDDRDDPDDQD